MHLINTYNQTTEFANIFANVAKLDNSRPYIQRF